MINEINKMLKTVADATTELKNKINKITEYLGDNIEVEIENIDDYVSCNIITKNAKLYKKVIFIYHVLLDNYITPVYVNSDNTTDYKKFNALSDALYDIKEFLNKEV